MGHLQLSFLKRVVRFLVGSPCVTLASMSSEPIKSEEIIPKPKHDSQLAKLFQTFSHFPILKLKLSCRYKGQNQPAWDDIVHYDDARDHTATSTVSKLAKRIRLYLITEP